MGTGKIIGGIVLIILGIIFYGVSNWGNTASYYGLERCNSFFGELGQELDSDTYESCQNIISIKAITQAGMILGGIFVIIGLVLIIIGAIQGKSNKKVKEESKYSGININSPKKENIIKEETKHSAPILTYPTNDQQPGNKTDIIRKENVNDEYLSRLEKLGEMKKNNVITEEEFNILKADVFKKIDNVSVETTKSDSLITNSNLKDNPKDSERQKKVKRYTSNGKPIYE